MNKHQVHDPPHKASQMLEWSDQQQVELHQLQVVVMVEVGKSLVDRWNVSFCVRQFWCVERLRILGVCDQCKHWQCLGLQVARKCFKRITIVCWMSYDAWILQMHWVQTRASVVKEPKKIEQESIHCSDSMLEHLSQKSYAWTSLISSTCTLIVSCGTSVLVWWNVYHYVKPWYDERRLKRIIWWKIAPMNTAWYNAWHVCNFLLEEMPTSNCKSAIKSFELGWLPELKVTLFQKNWKDSLKQCGMGMWSIHVNFTTNVGFKFQKLV